MRTLARCFALLVAVWLGPVGEANAQRLTLDLGEATVITLPSEIESVFVADPEIADVQLSSRTSLVVFGISTGRTSLYAIDADGRTVVSRDVRIEHNLTLLEEILRARFPGNRVILHSAPKTLLVEGTTSTPQEAEAIVSTLQGVIGDGETLINRLTVDTPTQVNIRVRVAEVSRNVDQRFGINLQALFNMGQFAVGVVTGRDFLVAPFGTLADAIILPDEEFGGYFGSFRSDNVSVDAFIDALDREGLVRTLAEPNLTAVSGQTASFLAGGEFPIPVAQDNDRTTIEFKPFGVALDFTPTVLSADRIAMLVRPEVSELTTTGAIVIDDLEIPALTVRRVETSVELGSGQSIVIGGLLQQSTRDTVEKLPGAGDLPVLGALFTSTEYQNAESELVVIVTPYVVRPTSPEGLETPLGRYGPTSPLERLLLQKAFGEVGSAPGRVSRGRLHGPVGFVY
ncbi:MAG: type II and III secretion system protein family protein [Pseudomonadota bacterium]